jgi:hypothetical protein
VSSVACTLDFRPETILISAGDDAGGLRTQRKIGRGEFPLQFARKKTILIRCRQREAQKTNLRGLNAGRRANNLSLKLQKKQKKEQLLKDFNFRGQDKKKGTTTKGL